MLLQFYKIGEAKAVGSVYEMLIFRNRHVYTRTMNLSKKAYFIGIGVY